MVGKPSESSDITSIALTRPSKWGTIRRQDEPTRRECFVRALPFPSIGSWSWQWTEIAPSDQSVRIVMLDRSLTLWCGHVSSCSLEAFHWLPTSANHSVERLSKRRTTFLIVFIFFCYWVVLTMAVPISVWHTHTHTHTRIAKYFLFASSFS